MIFIEQNNRIKDELKMKIIFPDGKEIKYIIPVMKYWEYTDNDLLKNKMYPLLPLQIFKLRYQMEQIKRNKIDNKEQKQQETITKAKETAETIAKEAEQLYNNKEINGEDYHKILLAIASIFEYLNNKYGDNQSLEEEVWHMTKTLYDPAVEKRKAMEIAKKLLEKEIDIYLIADSTDLSVEEVTKLKEDNSAYEV